MLEERASISSCLVVRNYFFSKSSINKMRRKEKKKVNIWSME